MSRSASGSTRSSSCRACSSAIRRTAACSATRRCSTSRTRDARLVGQHDRGRGCVLPDGRGRHALAVLLAAARSQPALRFGPAHEIKRRLLTFWNSVKFLTDYGNIEGFAPTGNGSSRDVDLRPLDRWLVERTKQLVAESTGVRGDADGGVSARSTRSSTTSRTGTSAARAAASTPSTKRRSGRSGTRSSSRCGSSRR